MPTIVELTLRRLPDRSLVAELHAELPRSRADLGSAPVTISVEPLRGLHLLSDAYGAALTAMALPASLHPAWQRARGYAERDGQGLHVRVRIDDPTGELHALRWELLRDPLGNAPLADQEGGSLARLVILDDLHDRALPARPALRALVAVAGPVDAAQWGLDPVDVTGEAARARQALGEMQADVLAAAPGLATLANLREGLRAGPHVLYLTCHGKTSEAGTTLYLVSADGHAAPITGADLAAEITALAPEHRPLLAVLVACEGASQEDAPLAAVGPLLARAGVPAVVAMQATISLEAAASFTWRLLCELRRDGRIDWALAAARKEMGSEWWVPVLWLRMRDGRLWESETPPTTAGAQVSFGTTQAKTVTIGDVAGHDIYHTTINVWLWDHFGDAVPAWLAQQLDQEEQKKDKKERLAAADLERLKQEAQRRWSQIDWIRAAQTYREKILDLYGSMHIFGMSQPVPLTNVFTDVYLLDKPSALRRHTIEELKKRPLMHGDLESIEQRREGRALVTRHKRLFILGQPGAGKTTFLKHLNIQAVQNQLDAIPIFVPLKAWSDTKLDLMDFLVHQFAICNFPNAKPFIETILDEGRAIVLFDGLDEVSAEDGKHQRTTQAIHEFAQRYIESRIVITCRTAATEYTFERFTYCEIADFTQIEIETFVGRWFQEDNVKRVAFLKAFAQPEYERLRDLARRPLLLTMLCLTFYETMRFPQRRAELYEEAIDALLKKWDNSRSIQRDQPYRRLSLGYKRQLLTELAAETFERSEFFISRAYLVGRIVRFLRRLPQADQSEDIDGETILRSIEAQHGVLIERAHGIYSFSHLTFHEYFAARYIANRQSKQSICGLIAQAINPQWKEILLLTTSMLDYDQAALLFHLWSEQLQIMLVDNPPLDRLLDWPVQQAQVKDLGSRATALAISMIDQTIQINQEIIAILENINRVINCDSDKIFNNKDIASPERTTAILRTRTSDIEYIINNTNSISSGLNIFGRGILNHEYNIESSEIFDHKTTTDTLTLLSNLNDIAFSIGLDFEHSTEFIAKIANLRAIIRLQDYARSYSYSFSKIATRFMHKGTNNQIPTFVHIPQRNWQLTEDQLKTFGAYLYSTELLLECLDLAAVEDRQAVLVRLLVPPE